MFAYFERERLNELKKVFYDTRTLYNSGKQKLLMNGIDFRWFSSLEEFDDRADQLTGDLYALNTTQRLADGTVPLEIWLRNAADEFSHLEEGKVFLRALDELMTRASGAPPIPDAGRVPASEEAIVHQNDMVAYGFLSAAQAAGASVARLSVARHDNQTPTRLPGGAAAVYNGTGWLLAPDLLMTNYHVVKARNDGEAHPSADDLKLQVRNTTAQFDLDAATAQGTLVPGTPELLTFDVELDYAVLSLPEAVQGRTPLVLSGRRVEVAKDSYVSVNIIQHPLGGPKMVALRNNLVYDGNYPKLRYFTDTEHGSSGSPVFDDEWKVVALHRAATFVENVKFQGRLTGWVNEGTQMAAILEHLEASKPEVYRKVIDGATTPRP